MRKVSIGKQDYESLIKSGCFYVDKTYFIKEWWESQDDVTLITRPRRFGKTLNMSMLECFFSNKYAGRSDLFEGLSIWKDEKYRQLQGTYPVIFLSFASVKETKLENAKYRICSLVSEIYEANRYLLKGDLLSDNEKEQFVNVKANMNPIGVVDAIKLLAGYMERYYGKKVIILIDEYDTPLQEAYVGGYWNDMVGFIRSFFNSTFKTNPYLDRAIMTGITTAEYSAVRKFALQTSNGSAKAETISKESIFSDLNNLNVITTTNDEYNTSFGFTESEVFAALDEAGLSDRKDNVKLWYDGFVLGLMVGQREDYVIKSNRESGFGRYDIIMLPCNIENKRLPAIVIEFKVHDSDEEKSLADTVAVAHKQIEEKRYDEEILALGIEKERIRHYGFAFEGKKVLIG